MSRIVGSYRGRGRWVRERRWSWWPFGFVHCWVLTWDPPLEAPPHSEAHFETPLPPPYGQAEFAAEVEFLALEDAQ